MPESSLYRLDRLPNPSCEDIPNFRDGSLHGLGLLNRRTFALSLLSALTIPQLKDTALAQDGKADNTLSVTPLEFAGRRRRALYASWLIRSGRHPVDRQL